MSDNFDVIVIGGGQSGLANAYYLRRHNLSFIILEKQEFCGGAWNHACDSLTLFSPAEYSSLPGWPLPKSESVFPLRTEVVAYLCQYIDRYQLPVQYETIVESIRKPDDLFEVKTSKGTYTAKVILAASGTWGRPFIPLVDGLTEFLGMQIHSAFYKNVKQFENKRVLVVGGGNSGAQIMAEISKVTEAIWSTLKSPSFLPEEVDGYDLFNAATAKYNAEKSGIPYNAQNYDLSSIVMVPPVLEARNRGALISAGTIDSFYDQGVIWSGGAREEIDAVIWCTGFGYDTFFLKELVSIDERGVVETNETRSAEVDGLWLSGYGNWTGFASATLIGINRNAKQTIAEIVNYLSQ